MRTFVKVLIVLAICFVLFVIAIVGAGYYWWTQNKQELVDAGKRAYAEGQEFGAKSDNQGCLSETITRYKANPGLKSSIFNNLFLRTCLKSSRQSPGFCDGVPKKTEFVASARWQVEQCSRVGLSDDSYCGQLFSQVQDYCEEDVRQSQDKK